MARRAAKTGAGPTTIVAIEQHDPENVADFLAEHGWRVLEHLGYDELAERCVKPTGRDLVFIAIERMVYSEKL